MARSSPAAFRPGGTPALRLSDAEYPLRRPESGTRRPDCGTASPTPARGNREPAWRSAPSEPIPIVGPGASRRFIRSKSPSHCFSVAYLLVTDPGRGGTPIAVECSHEQSGPADDGGSEHGGACGRSYPRGGSVGSRPGGRNQCPGRGHRRAGPARAGEPGRCEHLAGEQPGPRGDSRPCRGRRPAPPLLIRGGGLVAGRVAAGRLGAGRLRLAVLARPGGGRGQPAPAPSRRGRRELRQRGGAGGPAPHRGRAAAGVGRPRAAGALPGAARRLHGAAAGPKVVAARRLGGGAGGSRPAPGPGARCERPEAGREPGRHRRAGGRPPRGDRRGLPGPTSSSCSRRRPGSCGAARPTPRPATRSRPRATSTATATRTW